MISVIENKEQHKVIVGKIEIVGFVDNENCSLCSQNKVYYDDYDSYFCPQCNIWLESVCSDKKCEFCRNRPSEPLMGSK